MIAVRAESLNVYYRGASIFRIERQGDSLVPITHAKYLVRRQQGSVALRADGQFGLDADTALWSGYQGPTTLGEMMSAAATLAGPEKIGLHPLLLSSPHVIDVEVSFATSAASEIAESLDGVIAAAEDEAADEAATTAATVTASPASPRGRQDRLDVATLAEPDGEVRVVFHEAKHFANPDLRAAPERTPPVAEQVARYRQTLAHHAGAIGQSYREVCRALARIDAMRRRVQGDGAASLHPLIARVAAENIIPAVDIEPRLVVFGFDRDQREGEVWRRHLQRLTGTEDGGFGLKVHTVGNTQGRRTPAFTA